MRPSEDLGELAGELLTQSSLRKRTPRWIRVLLRLLRLRSDRFEADIRKRKDGT